jgi:hypothetical protein
VMFGRPACDALRVRRTPFRARRSRLGAGGAGIVGRGGYCGKQNDNPNGEMIGGLKYHAAVEGQRLPGGVDIKASG